MAYGLCFGLGFVEPCLGLEFIGFRASMDEENEEALRREATRIMASSDYEEETNSRKRRWLTRNCPEKALKSMDSTWFADYDKFISESFIRGKENIMFHGAVEKAFSYLHENTDREDEEADLKTLSDLDVLKELPKLVKTLRYSVVRSLYYALFGEAKVNKDRTWLENAVVRKVGIMMGGSDEEDRLKTAVNILRSSTQPSPETRQRFGVSAQATGLSPPEVIPRLPEICTMSEVMQTCLGVLKNLPLRCLSAVFDFLSEKEYDPVSLFTFKHGSNRREYIKSITNKANKLLNEDSGHMPEALQRGLRVISLYAREVSGEDGGLSQKLDPMDVETKLLQDRILSAILEINKLSFDDLEKIHQTLMRQTDRQNKMRHPRVYSESLKGILEEVLYRCTAHTLPECVTEALDMISAAKPQILKTSRGKVNKIQHMEAETEAMYNLSSCLRQVHWDYIENFDAHPDKAGEPSGTHAKVEKLESTSDSDSDDEDDYRFCMSQLKSEHKEEDEKHEGDLGNIHEEEDEDLSKDIVDMADEGALLTYTLVGGALEETLRGIFQQNARKYLRSGLTEDAPDLEVLRGEENEVDVVKRVVEQAPFLSRSVLHKIKSRLEDLKQKLENDKGQKEQG